MQYYIISGSARCMGRSPSSESGKAFSSADISTSPSLPAHVFLDNPHVLHQHLPDCIHAGREFLILSHRARISFENYEARNKLQFHPAYIHDKARMISDDYFLCYVTHRYSCIDVAKSQCIFYPGTSIVSRIRRWVLDESLLPVKVSLFRIEPHGQWIATEEVLDDVMLEGLNGFEFIPIWPNSSDEVIHC